MKLLEENRIGSLSLKNRLVFAPITTGFSAENGCFGQDEINFSVERAKGGAALIFTDAVAIDRDHQMSVPIPLPYIDHDTQISRYSRFVDAIHHHGAKIGIQLYHAGRQTSTSKRGGNSPVGPSAVHSSMMGRIPFPDSIQMSETEIEQVIQSYALAASRAQNAGFDAIDMGGGAGYLIQQFLSPLTNKRTDRWGGSLENRLRFATSVIKRIRSLLGEEFPLIFDLCLNEYMKDGISVEQGLETAEILESHGIDAFRIHGVNMETFYHLFPSTGSPYGELIPLGKLLKKHIKKAKIMLGQRINDPELAERIIQEEAADIILLARPLISDPYFPKKVMSGKTKSIRKCIGCNHCVDNLAYGKPIRCSVNPVVGFEQEYSQLTKTRDPKNVLIVGGGPAGMEAARVAAYTGHKVTLAEKNSYLGGQIKHAASTPYKEELKNIIAYYEHQLETLNIDVRLNCEIDYQAIMDIKPDTIILATGAEPIIPDIPGIDASNVIKATDILQHSVSIDSGPVVIIGGGSLGAEIAEMLALQGHDITIVEKTDGIAADMGFIISLTFHDRLDKLPIERITNATVTRVEEGKVYYTRANGEQGNAEAAIVVIATGYTPNNTLKDNLSKLVDDVIVIGDCLEPRKILDAVHEGFHSARLIGERGQYEFY